MEFSAHVEKVLRHGAFSSSSFWLSVWLDGRRVSRVRVEGGVVEWWKGDPGKTPRLGR